MVVTGSARLGVSKLRMPRARWREPTDELAERLRELNTEQTQDGNDNEEDDAANELVSQ